MNSSYEIVWFRELLERMLISNVTITARAITREPNTQFKHASDITRHIQRRALLEEFQARQRNVRQLAEAADKESVTNLQLKIARLEEACATSQRSRDLLIASHKAMILAVGEVGGMRAWVKFFPRWDEVRHSLAEMGAFPDQISIPLSSTDRIAE